MRTTRVPMLALACTAFLAAGCLRAPQPPGAGRAAPAPPAGGEAPQLHFDAPADWSEEEPGMAVYLRRWSLPSGGVATFSWLPGRTGAEAIAANVERWIGQWELESDAEGRRYEYEVVEGEHHRTHRLVGRGTLQDVRQLGGGEPRSDWMLVGAVLETAAGPVYFKLVAPEDAVSGRLDDLWDRLAGARVE